MHSLLRSHLCLVLFHSFFRFFLSRIFILFFALTTRWRATNHLHRCMRSLTILNVLLNWFLDPKKNDAVVFRSAISILWILVFFWSATRIFPCMLQPVSFFSTSQFQWNWILLSLCYLLYFKLLSKRIDINVTNLLNTNIWNLLNVVRLRTRSSAISFIVVVLLCWYW